MASPLNPIWSAHLPEKDRAEFENLVRGSEKVLDRLHQILYNRCIESENRDLDFDSPAWAYRAAAGAGARKVLTDLMKIIKVDQTERT